MTKPLPPSENPDALSSTPVVASAEEVTAAVTTCEAELLRGAEPLAFTDEAMAALRTRYEPAFRINLPKAGGWQRVDPVLSRVAFYMGVIARDIAGFHKASVIGEDDALYAGRVLEAQCKLAMEDNLDGQEGMICSDIDDIGR